MSVQKNYFIVWCCIFLNLLLFTACIKDEPLYREADITTFTINGTRGVISENNQIHLFLNNTETLQLTPTIELSEGATVTPASGETIDFSKMVTYTVLSEDKKYTKTYEVYVSSIDNRSYVYNFENWEMGGAGLLVYPTLADPLWTSANVGVAIAKFGNVSTYPTHSTTDAHEGNYAAMLETIEGGTFIAAGYVPVFSGSLFTGDFVTTLSNPVASTHFGQPHPEKMGKPVRFSGYYKYKPGQVLINRSGVVTGKIDQCSIHSIIFKVKKGDPDNEYLDGVTITNSDKIIAKAELTDTSQKNDFTYFNLPYIYTEEFDYDKYDYKITIVFASSKYGDQYEGAIGSTLIVDDVDVECTPFNN